MGIFDIFGTGDQQAAADAQIAGINAGLSGGTGAITSGLNELGNNTTNANSALSTNYLAGMQPFLQNYGTAYNGYSTGSSALNDALGLNGAAGSAKALQAWQNNPALGAALTVGNNATNAYEAATGKTASGNQLIDLSNNDMNIANQNWGQYIQSLIQSQGQYGNQAGSAASGVGGLYAGLGAGTSANDINLGNQSLGANTNIGNMIYGANTSIGNANANAQLAGLNASANQLGALMGGLSLFLGA